MDWNSLIEYCIYSQTSILRASILRGPLLYADFFPKFGTPNHFVCHFPCIHCVGFGNILCRENIVFNNDGIMKSLAIEQLILSL